MASRSIINGATRTVVVCTMIALFDCLLVRVLPEVLSRVLYVYSFLKQLILYLRRYTYCRYLARLSRYLQYVYTYCTFEGAFESTFVRS